jgi:hypothetical protein
MRSAALAGCLYFALVFAAGVALGVPRALVLAPRTGPLAAVLLELPLILAVAWLVCGRLLARLAVPGDPAARALMGGLAFALLIGAELLLALASGGTAAGFLAGLATPAGLLGLAGQAAFALLPLARA